MAIQWHPDNSPAKPPQEITLRDYFAGQALRGLYSQKWNSPEFAARLCYEIADALIAERDRQ